MLSLLLSFSVAAAATAAAAVFANDFICTVFTAVDHSRGSS